MIDRHFNPELPPRQTFFCRIKGHPFISRTDNGLTVCSLPVEISGVENRSRLILRGEAADRCLSHFRIGGFYKVTGIKKIRSLSDSPEPRCPACGDRRLDGRTLEKTK